MGNSDQGTKNKRFLEWIKAFGPYVVIFTVIGGGYNELLKLRSDMEEKAAARLLDTITLLDKSNSCTVRAGAVSTMGEYLRRDYTKYQDRTIQVVAYHLSEEDDSMVRIAILNLLKGAKADAIEPLALMNKVVIGKIENGSSVDESPIKERLLESFVLGNWSDEDSLAFDKLLAINEALVTLLRKNRREELDLSDVFLVSSEPINLENANLRRANLERAVLYKPDLTNTSLHGAVLEDASAADANLEGAVLRDAILVRANLESAVLRKADLTDADLSDANLNFANLEDAILERAALPKAQLERAILINTALRNAAMQAVDLEGANLEGANLEGAILEGANLTDANLSRAMLIDADLRGANLQGASLEDAIWRNAKLENANLKAKVLFRIDSKKFQSDLDEGTISEDLQQEFEDNMIYLSQSIAISMEEKDHRWLITDKDDEQTYTVRKERWLNICTEPNIVETELFGIDSKKFQSDFDKGTISEDLRQEFKNNWIDLSENSAISVKEKGRIWLITDKDNDQIYTVRKEEWLNICKETKFDLADIKKAENWDKAVFDDDIWEKLSSQKD